MSDSRIWFPMQDAPENGSDIEVMLDDGRVVTAHFARDLSGEEQPPFVGWFHRHGYWCQEVEPKKWRPIERISHE